MHVKVFLDTVISSDPLGKFVFCPTMLWSVGLDFLVSSWGIERSAWGHSHFFWRGALHES